MQTMPMDDLGFGGVIGNADAYRAILTHPEQRTGNCAVVADCLDDVFRSCFDGAGTDLDVVIGSLLGEAPSCDRRTTKRRQGRAPEKLTTVDLGPPRHRRCPKALHVLSLLHHTRDLAMRVV